MTGITIGSKHTFDDFGLKMLSLTVSEAEPIVTKVEVPGMDGTWDISEALGEIHYKERQITAVFDMMEEDYEAANCRLSAISNAWHGLRKKIILDSDKGHYYEGRVSVKSTQKNFLFYEVVVSANVYPYKKKINKTVVTAQVSGECLVICPNERMSTVPTITVDGDILISFGDISSLALSSGTHTYPDIKFSEGDNRVVCSGTGTITFTYQEGSL